MPNLLDRILAHPDVVTPPNDRTGEVQAWCPWHPDRQGGNPSLGINEKKGAVKCWVCSRGGIRELAKVWGLIDSPAPWQKEIESTYDYLTSQGTLFFQTVRFKTSPGAEKDIAQRQPDPKDRSRWLWSLKGVRPVLYRLPELAAADPDEWVHVVEGEKDTDRLVSQGLVATTNPMGAGKWRKYYNAPLKGRRVVVIPDNDTAGQLHAQDVGDKLQGVAAEVRLLELGELPEKGDISDWLDAGHTVGELADLVHATPGYQPRTTTDEPAQASTSYPGSRHWPVLLELVSSMKELGFFVSAGEHENYYFLNSTRELLPIEKECVSLKVFLNDMFRVNRQDDIYLKLVAQMEVEAVKRGQSVKIGRFSYYDEESQRLFMDMGRGNILRIDGKEITVRDNGADGVVFLPNRKFAPWEYKSGVPQGLISQTLIDTLQFEAGAETTFEPDEQRLLMLVWMLSLAFETLQPTKPLALAVGPTGSGKSNLFRRVGRLLFGGDFELGKAQRDKEEHFWISVTNRPFMCLDNADEYVRWLEDALATVSTGTEYSTRRLYETNKEATFVPHCFIALTARTPRFRREDVSSRLLIFRMDRLKIKRREKEILDQVVKMRDDLMSDYVRMLNRVVANSFREVEGLDQSIRLADFASLAAWIGEGLGPGMGEKVVAILNKLSHSQRRFAIEEDNLVLALKIWTSRTDKPVGQLAVDVPNSTRRVTPTALAAELRAIYEELGMAWRLSSPIALGKRLDILEDALSVDFKVTRGRDRNGSWWSFESDIPNEGPTMTSEEIAQKWDAGAGGVAQP